MKRTIRYARKTLVVIVSLPIFILGLILIPLPGPGLLVCLLALFILSLEFDFAKVYVERIKAELKKIWDTRHRFDPERKDQS